MNWKIFLGRVVILVLIFLAIVAIESDFLRKKQLTVIFVFLYTIAIILGTCLMGGIEL